MSGCPGPPLTNSPNRPGICTIKFVERARKTRPAEAKTIVNLGCVLLGHYARSKDAPRGSWPYY